MTNEIKINSQIFYERSTVTVAQDLLGCYVVRDYHGQLLMGMITETEAYQGFDDPASHAFRGKTQRNFPMFGPCGMSYVYFTYGMHFCFNVVAKSETQAAGAVLIRAIKPAVGIEVMYRMRGEKISEKNLTNGPAKLTQALAIDRSLNNLNLTRYGELFIASPECKIKNSAIHVGMRIGIRVGADLPWRFTLKEAKP